jgi:NACHT domain
VVDVGADVNELITELAVGVVASLGHKVAQPLRTLKDRGVREELELATWFDTYRLTDPQPFGLPPRPVEFTAEQLEDLLRSDGVHAVLHELLAARLTDAPEQDIAKLRASFVRIGTRKSPSWPAHYSEQLFDAFDLLLAGVAGRLEGARPNDFKLIRTEARSARITAILGAIERHTQALAGEVDIAAEQAFLDGYRRHLVEMYGVIEPPDFNHRRRVPVADLYVSPGIVEINDVVPVRIDNPSALIDIWRFFERVDRAVLLGDPGCGKTTASRVLLHHCAGDPKRRTPFLVTLREFAADDPPARSVLAYLDRELEIRLQHPAPPGLVGRLLLDGAAFVIFDGLDELLDPARRADVSSIIERFCSEYPLTTVLVTSRVVGYDQARLNDRQFTRYRIHGFDDQQVNTYVSKWFAQEDGLTQQESESWAATFVEESETVQDLRSNPLLLALMCILYRGEGSIPRNRCDVYERCADLLFRRWDSHRRIHVHLKVAQGSDVVVRRILQHLAYWLLTRDSAETAVTEKQLVAETAHYLAGRSDSVQDDEATEGAEEFVEFCRGRAWVFTDVGTTARGENLYTFTHRTFLEFFAARYLSLAYDTPEQLARELAPRVARNEWPVVAALAVQIKDQCIDRGAERLLLTLLGERRKRASASRLRILSLIAECLPWAALPVDAVERLTLEIIERTLAFQSEERGLNSTAIGLLFTGCWSVRDTVRRMVVAKVGEMVSSPRELDHADGIRLAVSVRLGNWALTDAPNHRGRQSAELNEYWRDVEFELIKENKAIAILSAAVDAGLFCALAYSALANDLESLLRAMPDLSPCFEDGDIGFYLGQFAGAVASSVSHLTEKEQTRTQGRRVLEAISAELSCRAPEMYPGVELYGWADDGSAPVLRIDDQVFLVCALAVALAFERTAKYSSGVWLPDLDRISGFRAHISQRRGENTTGSLPALPVPPAWQEAFDAWARGERNFMQ